MATKKPPIGAALWFDLTVPDARKIQDFYARVIGWKPETVPMGDYEDFNMTSPETGDPMAGICFARGGNADLPASWLIYMSVEDISASADACRENGGKLLSPIKTMSGHGKYCVIEDPAGAVMALFETE